MGVLNEGKHDGDYIHSEGNKTISRSVVDLQLGTYEAGTVLEYDAAANHYVKYNPAGGAVASAVLFANVDEVAVSEQVITARSSEVNGKDLVWDVAITALQLTTAIDELKLVSILVR